MSSYHRYIYNLTAQSEKDIRNALGHCVCLLTVMVWVRARARGLNIQSSLISKFKSNNDNVSTLSVSDLVVHRLPSSHLILLPDCVVCFFVRLLLLGFILSLAYVCVFGALFFSLCLFLACHSLFILRCFAHQFCILVSSCFCLSFWPSTQSDFELRIHICPIPYLEC